MLSSEAEGSNVGQRPLSARHRSLRIDEESAVGIHQVLGDKPIKSPTPSQLVHEAQIAVSRSWERFVRKGKQNVPVWPSLKAIFLHSWLNAFIIFVPLSWVAHFEGDTQEDSPAWPFTLTLVLSFLGLVSLANLFEYIGEQLAHYMGKDLGDLVVVTLNNLTEATLAFILISKCEIRLLQATIAGVILLHLCLIPGMAFFTGGARIQEQEIHPHLAGLNHVLLTTGVICLFLPAIILQMTAKTLPSPNSNDSRRYVDPAYSGPLFKMSRGLAFLLLAVYIVSRIYLHNPPGQESSLHQRADAPEELKHEEHHLATVEPEANQWVLVAVLALTIAVMSCSAEWLVDSIEPIRQRGIKDEWFGLILLPFIKFSADGAIASVIWIRRQLHQNPQQDTMAKAQAIDMSVQFILFWTPIMVLAGWWSGNQVPLVFDFFEIAALIGACLLVNYVTANGKTNLASGFALMTFYVMCALCSWFYEGQELVGLLAQCGKEFWDVVEGVTETVAEGG